MAEYEQPQLSLGEPPRRLTPPSSGVPRFWLGILLLLQLAVCGLLVLLVLRPSGTSNRTEKGQTSTADELKGAAVKLEERSLPGESAQMWEAYLDASDDPSARGRILYRIGSLYMQAEDFRKAATAFVRAEQWAQEGDEFKPKIGPKLVECLQRLGLYGEVGRELSRRVEVGAKSGDAKPEDQVIATLTGETLTEGTLDRMIERRVDQMLAMQGGGNDPERRAAMLKQLSSNPGMRQQLLQELLQTELFSRRARELKMDREEDYAEAKKAFEENLLASRFLSAELDKIRPTEVDIETYFAAHQSQYRQPDSLHVRVIELGGESAPESIASDIHSAEDFKKIAEKQQADENAPGPKSGARVVAKGRPDPQLGNTDALFALAEGEWTKTPLEKGKKKFLVLVEQKSPERTPALPEVKERVQMDYVSRKRQELMEQLFRDLMTRYDVRIKPPERTPPSQSNESKTDEPKADESKSAAEDANSKEEKSP